MSIASFGFEPGQRIGERYRVVEQLGRGWEAEVYKLREIGTGVVRAGKFFFPQRDKRGKTSRTYARKLHKLRNSPILIQYHSSGTIEHLGHRITYLLSEFVEGEILSSFLKRQPGKKIGAFQGLHLLYALARGMEGIHDAREYHGDLHAGNIIVRRVGISFDLKLLDMFDYGPAQASDIHDDVCDLIRIFYDAIGGAKQYASQPTPVKHLCRGLKRSLILKNFRNAGGLRRYLETLQWT